MPTRKSGSCGHGEVKRGAERAKVEVSDHSSVICITRANNAVKGGRVPSGRSLPPARRIRQRAKTPLPPSPVRRPPPYVQTIFCSFFIHSLRQCLTPRPHRRNCAQRGFLTTRHKFASPWRLLHIEAPLTLQVHQRLGHALISFQSATFKSPA